MCKLVNWKEMTDGRILFLTADMIYHTERGKELQKYNLRKEDWIGHGAIDFYYMFNREEGVQRECTNFLTPDNFPPEIVAAIKAGEFRGLGIVEGLLNEEALAAYEKIRQSARAKYEKIEQSAWDEYKKIEQSARAKYEKIRQSACDEYEKIRRSVWDEYEKIRQSVCDEYEKIEQPARAEYEIISQRTFWDLFADLENRNPLWV